MNGRQFTLALLLWFAAAVGFGAPEAAAWSPLQPQDAPAGDDQDKPPPTFPAGINGERLTARMQVLTDPEGGELEPALTRERELLQQTVQFLRQGATAAARIEAFAAEARSAPERLAQIEEFLGRPIEELITAVDASQSVAALDAQREATLARLEAEQELLANIETEAATGQQRRAEIPNERAVATERLEALSAQLAANDNPDDPITLAVARRWNAVAEEHLQQATLALLDEEIRNYDLRGPVLEKQRALRDRKIEVETRNAAALKEAIARNRIAMAEQVEQQAAQQRHDAANAHATVQEILKRNEEITASTTDILNLNTDHTTDKVAAEKQLSHWDTAYKRSRDRVTRVGLTNAIGLHLSNQLSRHPEVREIKRRMRVRDKLIGRLVGESEDWSLVFDELTDIEDAVSRYLAASTSPLPTDPAQRLELRQAVHNALLKQRDYLNSLSAAYIDYLDNTLLEIQHTERELVGLIEEFSNYINERILWIQSCDPLRPADIATSLEAGAWLVRGEAWRELLGGTWSDVKRVPVLYFIYAILLTVLLLVQPRLRRRMSVIAARMHRHTTDRFALTLAAIGVTILMAAAWPAVTAFIAWRLESLDAGEGFSAAVGIGLWRVSEMLFATELIRQLCRREGLGDRHFRWNKKNLQLVRRHLRWIAVIVIPLAFVLAVTTADVRFYESLGRLAFIVAMLAGAVFTLRVLHPSTGILRVVIARHPGGWLDRLRYLWFPLIVLLPVSTAVLAMLGYFYTALQIEQRALDSAWLMVLVLVGQATLLRGLFTAQRRLSIEQRKKKAAALAESQAEEAARRARTGEPPPPEAGTTETAPAETKPQSLPEDENIDVAALSAQTRQLLSTAVAFTLIIGMLIVWFDVLPAFRFLQQVELWTLEDPSATVAQVGDAGALMGAPLGGGSVAAPTDTAITLGHLTYAILILVVTAIVSRNMPGLLEITILQRLPISPSARYALTTVARYLLVIIGVFLAFGAIGIGWAKVQWLAAAITVGLGFGLQEIFANFVSGLIILFERPIRVGDTVTVGDISGTVSRIRIRATTVVDWDRKELIIPNKEFVTGQVVNWTLSDPILRMVIPVGIAYGSDTARAEQILLDIARADPVVLDDPEPTVVFTEFADSSLTFTLRVFIPKFDELFTTRHRLHMTIDQEFREAGIVIAFPQRDVHVHTAEPPSSS